MSKYDPLSALDGGVRGTDAIHSMLPDMIRLAASGAWILIEVGEGQAEDVEGLMSAGGLVVGPSATDLSGSVRVVSAMVAK